MSVLADIKALKTERLRLLARVVEIETELEQIAEAVQGVGEPVRPPRTHDARTPVNHKPSKLPPRPSMHTRTPRQLSGELLTQVLPLFVKHDCLTADDVCTELQRDRGTVGRVLRQLVQDGSLVRRQWKTTSGKPPCYYARNNDLLDQLETELIADGSIDEEVIDDARPTSIGMETDIGEPDRQPQDEALNGPGPITTDLSEP